MHPAALDAMELLKACREIRTKRTGPGGQHRNKVESAIVLIHPPTGISVEASERRSQAENRDVAVRRMRMKLAVEHRVPASAAGASDRWRSRVRDRRLVIAAGHEDFPTLLAEALDCLQEARWQVSPAAEKLGITTSQFTGFLRKAPAAWAAVNTHRLATGLPTLK